MLLSDKNCERCRYPIALLLIIYALLEEFSRILEQIKMRDEMMTYNYKGIFMVFLFDLNEERTEVERLNTFSVSVLLL